MYVVALVAFDMLVQIDLLIIFIPTDIEIRMR